MTKTMLLSCLALLYAGITADCQTNPKEIMKKSREQSKLSGMEAKTTLEILDGKGNTRTRETSMVSKIYPDGTEKRSIVFRAPAEVRGTGILIWDFEGKEDNMWIYMPSLRKSRKIVSTEKSKNFMGSEFSNADLAVASLDDFTYENTGTETVDGHLCWMIKITPVNPKVAAEYGISYKTSWISQLDLMPRKTIFYDLEGKPWKEMIFGGIRIVDDASRKYFVSRMEIRNLKNGRSSKMDMSSITYNPAVGEEPFTLAWLEKQ